MIIIKLTTADRLKQIMKERDIKQVDILNLCRPYCQKYNVRLNKNDLSQYIANKYSPSQEKLSILAMALKVNEVWLMGYDVPSDENDFKNLKKDTSEQAKLHTAIKNAYGKDTLDLVNNYQRLDNIDKIKINERIEVLLEDDKYKKELKQA